VTSTEEPTVNVKFCLAFPCEAVSVPVMRRILGDTLRNLGVVEDCVADILIAVTEACTNVLRHSGPTRRYEVVTSVGRAVCMVEVVDSGLGLARRRGGVGARVEQRRPQYRPGPSGGRQVYPMPPARRPEDQLIAQLAESGRGLQIMRALVDDVTMQSGPDRGTVVSMRKRVAWRRDAPLVGLSKLRDVG